MTGTNLLLFRLCRTDTKKNIFSVTLKSIITNIQVIWRVFFSALYSVKVLKSLWGILFEMYEVEFIIHLSFIYSIEKNAAWLGGDFV